MAVSVNNAKAVRCKVVVGGEEDGKKAVKLGLGLKMPCSFDSESEGEGFNVYGEKYKGPDAEPTSVLEAIHEDTVHYEEPEPEVVTPSVIVEVEPPVPEHVPTEIPAGPRLGIVSYDVIKKKTTAKSFVCAKLSNPEQGFAVDSLRLWWREGGGRMEKSLHLQCLKRQHFDSRSSCDSPRALPVFLRYFRFRND